MIYRYGLAGESLEVRSEVELGAPHVLMNSDRPDPNAVCTVIDGEGVWVVTLEKLAFAALQKVDAEYTKRMGAIAETYPLHERESWPIQLAEAQTVLLYQGGELPEGVTSTWIDQCAHQRGMTRMELAQRIVTKDTAYRTVSGFLSGVRQWHEDCIDLLLTLGEEARDELRAYDHLQGWEPLEDQRSN